MKNDPTTEYYVPDKTMHSSKDDEYSKWNFKYNPEKDVYICPEGKELEFVRVNKDSRGIEYRSYQASDCKNCGVRDKCQKLKGKKKGNKNNKPHNRTICIYSQDEDIKIIREKLDSDEGQIIYQVRMSTVEPVHGDMQNNRGFVQFILRGLDKVNVEYNLLAIAHNIRKIMLHRADALKKLLGKAKNVA